jgi:two-component system, OmpR family, heavy metal sensor histidine kinase CusS
MKSIRLSLVLYFLVLLGLALGAVSGVVYWTTAGIVKAREDTTRELLRAQHGRRRHQEKEKFDNALVIQARTLANQAQFQYKGNRVRFQMLAPLGILTAAPGADGCLLSPLWAGTTCKGPLAGRMYNLCGTEIQFNEEDIPPFPDGPVTEYFQITSEWGNSWRSRSLGEHSFPVSAKDFETLRLFDWRFDNPEVEPGVSVRRVTLNAPVARFRYVGSGWPRPEPPTKIRPDVFVRSPAMLLIECACDTTRLNATLQGFQAEFDEEVANLAAESRTTLTTLRDRLVAISLAAFAACVLGGFCLVRLGLAPLRRLSDAVSQVSERDCRLQFDGSRLPSELRPIVERLEQALGQLQRAFAREKQAAADISHELRTPLAALLTTTEVALRKPRSLDEYREMLGDCRDLGHQMSQLVERLLALARLDAGVDTLRLQEVDAGALAEQCAALVRPLAVARDLRLYVHRGAAACVTADPDKLREVLTNLLHNAIEYNHPQGSVDVRVERANGHLHVEVSDTGIGIARDSQVQIFERFFRADPARHATGLHAGLGLAIVKGYVDLMGGSITVESVEGQGSTFRVRLPANSKPEANGREG